jgi:hypothetical protein
VPLPHKVSLRCTTKLNSHAYCIIARIKDQRCPLCRSSLALSVFPAAPHERGSRPRSNEKLSLPRQDRQAAELPHICAFWIRHLQYFAAKLDNLHKFCQNELQLISDLIYGTPYNRRMWPIVIANCWWNLSLVVVVCIGNIYGLLTPSQSCQVHCRYGDNWRMAQCLRCCMEPYYR